MCPRVLMGLPSLRGAWLSPATVLAVTCLYFALVRYPVQGVSEIGVQNKEKTSYIYAWPRTFGFFLMITLNKNTHENNSHLRYRY